MLFTKICPTCPECLVSTNISNIFPKIAWPGYRICNLGGCTWESDQTLQTEAVCTSLLTIFLLLLYYRNSKVLHRPAHKCCLRNHPIHQVEARVKAPIHPSAPYPFHQANKASTGFASLERHFLSHFAWYEKVCHRSKK